MTKITAARRRSLEKFQEKLGVQFKNLKLLDTALTHSSYTRDLEDSSVENYERLEFLGDAVLELASSTYLYKNFPNLSEGELTVTRANVVRGTTLSKLAAKLGVGEMLILGYSEDSMGGRARASNLEDAFEAIIGAIYLDSGWKNARDYVWRQLASEFENVKIGNVEPNYKSILQEFIQQQARANIVEYFEVSESGPPHDKTFECAVKIDGEVYGSGVGKSKKLAEQAAASVAIKKLNIEV